MAKLFGFGCVGVADSIQDHRFVNNFFLRPVLFFSAVPATRGSSELADERRSQSVVEKDLRECVRRSRGRAAVRGGVSLPLHHSALREKHRLGEVRTSWSTVPSPSSYSIKIFSRCIGEIRKSQIVRRPAVAGGAQASPQCERSGRRWRFSPGSGRLPGSGSEVSFGSPQPLPILWKGWALRVFPPALPHRVHQREGRGT